MPKRKRLPGGFILDDCDVDGDGKNDDDDDADADDYDDREVGNSHPSQGSQSSESEEGNQSEEVASQEASHDRPEGNQSESEGAVRHLQAVASQDTGVVGGSPDGEDVGTPSLYRQLDNERERQEEEELLREPTDGLQVIPPYFPKGLAMEEKPLEFNFGMFLFDSLSLPFGLFEADHDQPVNFPDSGHCQLYCELFVTEALAKRTSSNDEQPDIAQATLHKEAMFHEAGSSLSEHLATGLACCDDHLYRVRKDRFGNIMVWGSPIWSDTCPNFMHGFPRRLISARHAGLLPGNICVAAKVSNQAMRSISPGDIASFCARAPMENLGLTVSELFLARQSALSYSGRARQPQRLVQTMLRYGIDFLTFGALDSDALESLSGLAATLHQQHVSTFHLETAESSSGTDSSDESVELDMAVVCKIPQRDTRSVQESRNRMQSELFHRFVGQCRPLEPYNSLPVAPRAMTSSGRQASVTKRKRRNGASHPSRAQLVQEPELARRPNVGADIPEEETLRQRLAEIPGIQMNHVPGPLALSNLAQFLTNHIPVGHSDVSNAEVAEGPPEPQVAALRTHKSQRVEEVSKILQGIWALGKQSCTCSIPLPGQQPDTPSDECPYRESEKNGEAIHPASGICNAEMCTICLFFSHYVKISSVAIWSSINKNARMQTLISLGTVLVDLAWLETLAGAEEQKQLKELLMALLCCKVDKLNSVLGVGYLAQITPRIKQVCLLSGWSQFWKEMRKIGTAMSKQASYGARLAVLVFMRITCAPANSPWLYYLTSEDVEEGRVMNELLREKSA